MCTLLALAVACGPGIGVLEPTASPLAVLNVRVDVQDLRDRAEFPDQLYVGIAWGAAWENPAVCHAAPHDSRVQAACRNPLSFIPVGPNVAGGLAALTAIERQAVGEVDVSLELMEAPPPEAAIGDSRGRISYGAVVAFSSFMDLADLARGGYYDSYDSHAGSLPSDSGGGASTDPRAEPGANPGPGQGDSGSEAPVYSGMWQVLSASFMSLGRPHVRVVARQDAYDESSNYYPYPRTSCGSPKRGFSLLHVDTLTSAPDEGTCHFSDASDLITLDPVTTEASSWSCQTSVSDHYVQAPNESDYANPWVEVENFCIGSDVIVMRQGPSFASGGCPDLTVTALVGCRYNLLCANPEWDWRGSPPADWPCP